MATIRAGYRFTVETCENDGDYYSTSVLDGLTYAEAKFLADFLGPFKKNRWAGNQYVGNVYDPNEYELEQIFKIFQEVVDRHPAVAQMWEGRVKDKFDAEAAWELYGWKLGLTGHDENQYTRDLQRVLIEFVPKDIEFDDVTKAFINE